MPHDRREFLGQLVLGALPLSLAPAFTLAEPSAQPDTKWDLSWTDRVKGKYRAVFDVPEIDQGYGVWRASFWEQQYQEVLGAKPADLSSVLVLRHNGIALAMQQAYWDKHALGKTNDVKHPLTQQATDRNPVLLASSRNEVPAELDDVALDVLVGKVAARDGGALPALRQEAIASFVPGVILQPSGVFAALRAQDVGCKYLRAS